MRADPAATSLTSVTIRSSRCSRSPSSSSRSTSGGRPVRPRTPGSPISTRAWRTSQPMRPDWRLYDLHKHYNRELVLIEERVMRLLLTGAAAVLIATLPASAFAQDAYTKAARSQFDLIKVNLSKTAVKVSEDLYSFKPTPEVRSLGEIIGHVADSNFA